MRHWRSGLLPALLCLPLLAGLATQAAAQTTATMSILSSTTSNVESSNIHSGTFNVDVSPRQTTGMPFKICFTSSLSTPRFATLVGSKLLPLDSHGCATRTGSVPQGTATNQQTVFIYGNDDSLDEPDEVVTATLSADPNNALPTGVTISTTAYTSSITIRDDDPTAVSLARVGAATAINEGGKVEFTVTLGRALIAGETIDVPLSIAGTGVTAADWSLAKRSGTGVSLFGTDSATPVATFSGAGAETATLELTAAADGTYEGGSESFAIALGSGSDFDAGDLGTNVGGGANPSATQNSFSVQVNDTATPPVSITRGTSPVTEGTAATFTLTASPAPAGTITVNVDVTDSGSFADGGQTGARPVTVGTGGTASLTVTTVNDSTDEPHGTIAATVQTGNGYTVGSPSSASVTVNDNDDPPVTVMFSSGTYEVAEGAQAMAELRLSGPRTQATQVNVSVTSITATAYVDFDGAPRAVTIPAGQTKAALNIATTDDTIKESHETFMLSISPSGLPSGVTRAAPFTSTVTILDDDGTPTLSIAAPADADEGAGTTRRFFTVALSRPAAGEVRYAVCFAGTAKIAVNAHVSNDFVDYRVLHNRTAVPSDCVEDVALAPGATDSGRTVGIEVLGDTASEPDETVVATLSLVSAPADVVLGTSVATHTVRNDDGQKPVLTLARAPGAAQSVLEGGAAVELVLDRYGAVPVDDVYDIALTLGGTALMGPSRDYRLELRIGSRWYRMGGRGRSAAFPIFELPARLRLVPLPDAVVEGDEAAVLTLVARDGYEVGTPSSVTLTIGNGPPAATIEALAPAVTSRCAMGLGM